MWQYLSVLDLSKDESPWKVCKGSFLQVGLFCIPARCEFAPQGLSKFSHLNDGCMELVLVKDINRKDFIRFLKRNGNSKNQVGLCWYLSTPRTSYSSVDITIITTLITGNTHVIVLIKSLTTKKNPVVLISPTTLHALIASYILVLI